MDGNIPSGAGRRTEALAVNPAAREYAFDDYDLERFLPVAAGFGQTRYGFVVTPNVDHLVRLQSEPRFAYAYNVASYVLLDSRLLARVLRWQRDLELPVCAGSELTELLLRRAVLPDDRIVLIGGTLTQARRLAATHGLRRLMHYNPPMGFIKSPAAIEQTLRFIEEHSPFRYCLLAVGSPQQEFLAQALRTRNRARGLALCVGASVDFLTGMEVRAPRWMRALSLEWLWRALHSPRRLGMRYLRGLPGLVRLLRTASFGVRAPAPRLRTQVVDSFTVPTADAVVLPRRNGSVHPSSPAQTG